MDAILVTTDPVRLSWARAVLAAEGIETLVFDEQMSMAEGSIGAFPRRLMVAGDDAVRARRLLDDAAHDLNDGAPVSTPSRVAPARSVPNRSVPTRADAGIWRRLAARLFGPAS